MSIPNSHFIHPLVPLLSPWITISLFSVNTSVPVLIIYKNKTPSP